MMTTNVMSAGDGYRYYTESVATADVQRRPGTAVTDYYTVDGNPPGIWMGRGAELLGMRGEVTEAQMRALYGEGLHPDADAITAQMGTAGARPEDIEKAIKLGRSYYTYDVKETTLRKAIDKAKAEFERIHGHRPDRDEHRQIRMREGAIVFRDVHGRQPLDDEELAKYVTNALKPAQHAMAGIDHTFSVPKSVSLAWALGDKKTARDIETAHERAIERTLKRLEDEVLATRAGINGVRQISVEGGVIATRFRHYESRAGDPHLHDHVVISAKVQGADGKWRSLDSRALLRNTVYLSESYNKNLFDELDQLGYHSTLRTVTEGKPPVFELDNVDPRLGDLFSKRSKGIIPATDELVKEYIQEHGRTPDHIARRKISEQAWQQTRQKKETARTVSQLRADVDQEARARGLGSLVDQIRGPQGPSKLHALADPLRKPIDAHAAAAEIMANVEASRSTWGENHVKAEIERYLSQHRYRRFTITDGPRQTLVDPQQLEHFLLRTTLQLDSIRVTPEHIHGRFQPLTRASDNDSVYTSKGRTLYTSTRVLEAEARLLNAARTPAEQPAPVTAETFAIALAAQPNKDTAQVRLARELVTNRTRIVVGVGPAGAGKTSRSLRLAAHALRLEGQRMVGLAPSKHAAKVFQDEVHVPAFTIDGFLQAHRNAAAKGRPVSDRYHVNPGDVVVVDEAAMASTSHLDQVTTIVTEAGGFVRLVGDHAQITAVGAGGAFRLLRQEVGAVELETVYRFSDKHERDASLVLRESAPSIDPFAWYKDHQRIIAGSKERIAEILFNDYIADLTAGREAIMGAPTRAYVDELNGRAQALAVADGRVRPGPGADLNDGHQAHIGDRIMTRLNRRDLTMNQGRDSVDNGDIYVVHTVHPDGALTAVHTRHGGTITLPADYVRTHTHLGYAFTAHQEQGNTVGGNNALGQFVEGVSRGIVTAQTPRSSAYVLATRGVTNNVLYVETEPGQHPDEVLEQIARNVDTNLSAHETVDIENTQALNLARLVDEHADIAGLANEARFTALASRVLQDRAESLTASDGWGAASAGLARAEKYGLDPADMLTETWSERDFGDAEDIGAVMSWRIEKRLEDLNDDGKLPPLPELGADTGRYEWAVDRDAQQHPDVPDTWRDHLRERAEYIDQRMTQRGVELTIERPAWTDQLGPVPATNKHLKRWMRLAAEIDLFRAKYNVPADDPAAIPERLRNGEVGQALAARVTALHKSTALRSTRGNDRTVDVPAQLRKAEDLARLLDQKRPRSDAERAAAVLDPAHRDHLTKKLDQLRQRAAAAAEAAADSTSTATGQAAAAEATRRAAEEAARRREKTPAPTPVPDLPAPARQNRGPSQ